MNVFTKSKWIWAEQAAGEVNQYCDFHARFFAHAGREYTFRVSAESNFEAYLNGKLIAFGQYADYPDCKFYNTVQLEDLCEGENRLDLLGYSHGTPTMGYVPGQPSLIFEVTAGAEVVCASGRETLSRICPYYHSGEMYRITGQLGYSFRYFGEKDDRFSESLNGYAPSRIVARNCQVYKRPVASLTLGESVPSRIVTQGVFRYRTGELGGMAEECGEYRDNIARLLQNAYLSQSEPKFLFGRDYAPRMPLARPLRFQNNLCDSDGVYFLVDLAIEQSGAFHLDLRSDSSLRVIVAFGEHLDDLRVRSYISTRNFVFEVYTRAGKRTDFTALIRRIGARYLQVYVEGNEFELYDCSIRPTDYPVRELVTYPADPFWYRLYEVAARTLRLCMHEHYEDCPWREQAFYNFDSRSQILAGYALFGERDMPRACLSLMAKSLRANGHMEICAPARQPITIPIFTLSYLLILRDYLKYTGEKDFVQALLPTARSVLNAFISRLDERGLMPVFVEPDYWNFYEWSREMDGMPIEREHNLQLRWDAPLSAFTYLALDAYREICATCDLNSEPEYLAAMDAIRSGANRYFFSGGRYASYLDCDGRLSGFCEFTNIMFLYAGIVPAAERESLADLLLSGESGMTACTIAPLLYLYEAALRLNREKFLPIVRREMETRWGKMLFAGATTFWETEKGADDFYYAGSLCHGWAAFPVYLYEKYYRGNENVDSQTG